MANIKDDDSLKEIAKQLKRIADAMERKQKIDLASGELTPFREALKARKDELLSNIKRKSGGEQG